MKLELKNVKHFEAGSQETHCFVATLYVDGKRFAIIENDGHGGADFVNPIKPGQTDFRKRLAEVEAYCTTLPSSYDSTPSTLEEVVCDLLNAHLARKDLKRTLRSKALMVDGGKMFSIPLRKRTFTSVEGVLRDKYPSAVWLNALPEDEALTLYRAH